METAKIFMNGGSQAVRLPKDCRFEGDEVITKRVGDVVILMPKGEPWMEMKRGFEMFSDDYLSDGIQDLPMQKRVGI